MSAASAKWSLVPTAANDRFEPVDGDRSALEVYIALAVGIPSAVLEFSGHATGNRSSIYDFFAAEPTAAATRHPVDG